MKNKTYSIRVRAFDNMGMIVNPRTGEPDSIVDLIVPVKTDSIKSAYKSAVLKVRNRIRVGWPSEDFDIIGTWKATKVTPADIKEMSK